MNSEFSNLLKWDSETIIRQIAFIPLTVKERILEKRSVTGIEYETGNITGLRVFSHVFLQRHKRK